MTLHIYLSTGCYPHGHHDYCKNMTGFAGTKRPGQCKFCTAECICGCHQGIELAEGEVDAGAVQFWRDHHAPPVPPTDH